MQTKYFSCITKIFSLSLQEETKLFSYGKTYGKGT